MMQFSKSPEDGEIKGEKQPSGDFSQPNPPFDTQSFDLLSNIEEAKSPTVHSSVTSSTIETQLLVHHTPIEALPLIFKYGLYLSAVRFTTFCGVLDNSYQRSWTTNMVGLAFNAEVVKTKNKLGIGLPEPIKLPDELRKVLLKLDAEYEPRDHSVSTSRHSYGKSRLLNGAHRLLIEEKEGTLRRFGPESIDIAKSRECNHHGRYRSIILAYLDALERNNGQPLLEPVKYPPIWKRLGDFIAFRLKLQWNESLELNKEDEKPEDI